MRLLYFLYIDGVLPWLEKAMIARIRRQVRVWPGVTAGIGDDCAVLKIPTGHEALVTTDFTLESVHFRREWHTPESVGHRCLARGLSDIAAMGGNPLAAFLSLALPAKLPQPWVDRFFRGFRDLADEHHVTLAGGDIAQSPHKIFADIMVVGSVPKGQAVLRSGARPGDLVYVTGKLGGSAEALHRLERGQMLNRQRYLRHFFPEPRLKSAQFLRAHRAATAMIDLSDGLSTDLAHICEESGVGARIVASMIPRANIGKSSDKNGRVSLDLALHGGEDYELLFTARPNKKPKRIAGIPVSQIGLITREKRIILVNEENRTSKLEARGWEHFAK